MQSLRQSVVAAVITIAAVGSTSAPLRSQATAPDSSGSSWPLWGGDAANTRFSPLTQITPRNVSSLGGAWVAHLNGEFVQAAPVASGGLVFVPTVAQHLYALNAKTGQVVWRYQSDVDRRNVGVSPPRGVALGEGLVFLPQGDTRLVALRQATGEVVWSRKIGDENPPARQSINAAPLYVQGLVISGLAGGDAGIRGRVTALDAKTGTEVWRFYTIPGPGEFGHDTWPRTGDAWQRGGGAVWTTPAADADLGLVYFNTGNAWPDFVGDNRAGDNLFTASVVALDLKTGTYRWHFQLVHHDIWDMDAAMSVVLFDTMINGQPRKAVATFRPDGYLFLLDRQTGRPLYPVQERSVGQEPRQKTSATQPYPVGADQVVPNCVSKDVAITGFELGCFFDPYYHDRPNLLVPLNGTRHAPMSYAPPTQYFYSVADVHPYQITQREDHRGPGGAIRNPPGVKSYGLLTATDSRTNKTVWQKRLPYRAAFGGGVLTTASGLVFLGQPDGNFQAFDARTGERLWQFQTGYGADGAATAFAVDGEEYVALTAGGSNFTGGARGDAVWAFKLNGTVSSLPAPTPPPAVQSFAGPVANTNRVELGPTQTAVMLGASGFGDPSNDDYTASPVRIKVTAGTTVTWTNTGTSIHGAVARDGSWRTGPIRPGASASVKFDRRGTFAYVCEEHPWTIAELIVE